MTVYRRDLQPGTCFRYVTGNAEVTACTWVLRDRTRMRPRGRFTPILPYRDMRTCGQPATHVTASHIYLCPAHARSMNYLLARRDGEQSSVSRIPVDAALPDVGESGE